MHTCPCSLGVDPWFLVMHVLKNNPVLRELEHIQVDGLGTAYLFFYDKQGHHGWVRILRMQSGLTWRRFSCSTHFAISLLPLVEAWQPAVATSDHRRLRGQAESPRTGKVHLLPHQTGKYQTLMVTSLQVRLKAISTIAGATEGVGRRSSWLLQDWIC